MAIKICTSKCSRGCNEYLLKDSTVGGDYFDGILHSWCDKCGIMHGPDTYAMKELSKRQARKVAVRLAAEYGFDYKTMCEVAEKLSPTCNIEDFSIRFSVMVGNKTNERIYSSMVISEIFRVI